MSNDKKKKKKTEKPEVKEPTKTVKSKPKKTKGLQEFVGLVDGEVGTKIRVFDWDSELEDLAAEGLIRGVRRNLTMLTWLTPKGAAVFAKEMKGA